MDWPNALIGELASRRCMIFLGAGASAGCLSSDGTRTPPTWKGFLDELKTTMPSGTDTRTIDDILSKDKFLDAAEIILSKISPADFSRIIRQLFVQPRYSKSRIHEAVLKIDPKIVITTNYDDIYDNYCRSGMAVDGYNTCKYYEQHLINDLRSPVRLVIKAHGCVSDPSKIVLARSQYFKQKQHHSSFYNVLDALFLTNTLLFIGYSLSDPDIQLVLENSNIAAPSSHTHYAIIPNDIPHDIEQAAAKAYNIHFLKFSSTDYQEVENSIEELSDLVIQDRVSNPS
jgi:hypothetical protein